MSEDMQDWLSGGQAPVSVTSMGHAYNPDIAAIPEPAHYTFCMYMCVCMCVYIYIYIVIFNTYINKLIYIYIYICIEREG